MTSADEELARILCDVCAVEVAVEPDSVTVLAEKLHAMVLFGMRNSRMKDYFDVHGSV